MVQQKQFILTPELEQYRAAGHSYRECAKQHEQTTGVPFHHTTIIRAFRKKNKEKQPVVPNTSLPIIEQDKKIQAAKAEVLYYKNLYSQAIKDAIAQEKIIEVVSNLASAIPETKTFYVSPSKIITSPLSVVAPICDTHIGERVSFDQMGGLNRYDMNIFNRRLRGWAQQVVNLSELRRNYAPVPKLYVPMLGDMNSGNIHAELRETNADNILGQMIRGANMIAQALMFLSQYFEEISVPCVVGNHGRITIKPPAKDKYVDWDYIMYQWIASFCRNQRNIKFTIPKSFLHVFEVANSKILILHGDSIKSWLGIPAYGIMRTVSQLRQTLQTRSIVLPEGEDKEKLLSVLSSSFDAVMLGHFHQQVELDIGTGPVIVASCFKGADEFSFSRLHTVSKPCQIFTVWHPKYGYISKDVIYLQRYDNAEEQFVDALPDVWAEQII